MTKKSVLRDLMRQSTNHLPPKVEDEDDWMGRKASWVTGKRGEMQ